jgi:N-methylhydantoinase B
VAGSDIVDLAGSSPGRIGDNVPQFTYAYVHMAIKSIFDPDIPNNDGSAAPIHLNAPEGTLVNCRFPAAVAARMQIGHFMTEIIYRALAQALPTRVIAASGGTPATQTFSTGGAHRRRSTR